MKTHPSGRPRGLTREEAFRWYMPGDPPEEGCWEWQGVRDPDGYGKANYCGKQTGAHRLSYEIHRGPIPRGMSVLHDPAICNNRACVNPDHLRLGTQAENMRDRLVAGTYHRGGDVYCSKLTEDDVRAIRSSHAEGASKKGLARQYGVTDAAIHAVVTRRTWKHVE